MTWQRLNTGQLNTALARPDTGSLPVLRRTRRVPAWTMWTTAVVSVAACMVLGCLLIGLPRTW